MHIAAMIIGFAQRRRTVSEVDRAFPHDRLFFITVDVRSMVVSEINYNVSFEAPASNIGRTANVADSQPTDILAHDALFGTFNAATGDLETQRLLINESTITTTPLTLAIINDFKVEPLECFTISIVSPDRGHSIYECFDDDESSNSFFCLHEICIENDDGLFIQVDI